MSRRAARPARASRSGLHTLRRITAWALGLVLFAATASALAVAVYPLVTGGSALAVLSGSMTPGLPVGGMIFTRPVDPAAVAVGDVITFQRPSNPSQLVTHRVIAVDASGGAPVFTTQGDANDAADLDPVPATAVQGELWFSLPNVGRLGAVLHSPKGLGALVLLVCAVAALAPGSRAAGRDAGDAPEQPLEAAARSPEGTTLIPRSGPQAVALPPVPVPRSTAARPGLL